MSDRFNWGILGAGGIAARFATDLKNIPDAQLLAVGSRSQDKAQDFADRHGGSRAYGSYEELVQDPDVDAIYVATPHNFHRDHTLLALEHGKAVLCEKPMEINAERVGEMARVAREKNLFLMEAMWTRFLPVISDVRQWLQDGRIGEIRYVTADFGFRTGWNPSGRLLNPELAGGSTLDVGVYVAAFAHMVLGTPNEVVARAHLGETGVDEQTAMLLSYDDGALAQLTCAVRTAIRDGARIYGTEGWIDVPEFWHAQKASLNLPDQESVVTTGEAGYHFEAIEVMDCVRAGKTESSIMPLDESIAIAETLEAARRQIGLRYAME